MDQPKDVSSRIREQFLNEIDKSKEHAQLAKPLEELMSDATAMKPEQVVDVFKNSVLSESNNQEATK